MMVEIVEVVLMAVVIVVAVAFIKYNLVSFMCIVTLTQF